MTYDAIVVGAGLAGLSAAFELAERKQRVLVIDAAKQAGGRTSNWKENGMDVESGIHKFIGVYKELPRLLRRAGLDLKDIFIYQDEIEIRVAEGGDKNADPQRRRRSGRFGFSLIHRPLLTVGGALGNTDLLSLQDKVDLARFFGAGLLPIFAIRNRWIAIHLRSTGDLDIPVFSNRIMAHSVTLKDGETTDFILFVDKPANTSARLMVKLTIVEKP